MKILKLKSILFGLMAVVMVTVFLTSCEEDFVKPYESNNNITSNKYSGENYFRGIFLLENEIASKIPSLEYYLSTLDEKFEAQPDFKEEFTKYNNEIVNSVKNRDNEYFTSLKLAIESNNASKVEAAIDYGSILVNDAAIVNYQQEANELNEVVPSINMEDYDLNTDEGQKAYLSDAEAIFTVMAKKPINESEYSQGRWVWYIAAAAHQYVAVTAYVAVAYAAFFFKQANDYETVFEKERFVSEILELNN